MRSWRGSIDQLYQNPQLPPHGRKATLGQMVRPSPYEKLVYELKPGLDVIFRGVPVRTNERGWREQSLTTAPPAGTLRILGIGDSTMFGWGVREEQRYMDRLEQRLNQAQASRRWQAIVTAVPGYNLMMEVESLARYGAALEPDLIVYGWEPNDQCLPHFLLQRRGLFTPSFLLAEYLRGARSKLPKLRSKERLGARCQGDGVPERYRPVAGRAPFEDALAELARVSTERGVPVVLVGGFGLDFETSMALSVPEDLHYVGAESRAETVTPRELVLSRSDPHASELGHRLLADALFEELESAGLWQDLESMEGSTP